VDAVIRLALLVMAWAALIYASGVVDPALRYIITAAVLIVGVVVALVAVGAAGERLR
jgi:hypothetical protein